MTTMMMKARYRSIAGCAALALVGIATSAGAQSFFAVLNEATSQADSRRSVTYFDGNDLGAGPLFSVFIPFEIRGTSSNAYEDPSAITVNPLTGDIYILAFDSGTTAGQVDDNGTPGDTSDDDTIAVWDLYRLNFSSVYDHWKTNYQGQDVRSIVGPLAVGGAAPTATQGASATDLQDYVTYGAMTPYGPQVMVDLLHLSPEGVFDQSHSNTFRLDASIEKIGELNRNLYSGSSNFHAPTFNFIDQDTLFMTDDARQAKNAVGGQLVANDYDFRIIERVSTSPGMATSNGINGGYNNTTSESWESRRIGQMLLDADEATSLLSDPQSSAYYNAGGGVRGVWVADRDTTFTSTPYPVADGDNGDDIAFLQLDSNGNSLGYRQFVGGATKFQMSNDPANSIDNLGRVGKLFVDSDTGDLIVIEEGFQDSPAVEPAVLRVSVNYDSSGQIALGTWSQRMVLGADLVGGLPKDTNDTFKERGYWSAYDSVLDRVYFMSPGETDTDPLVAFAADIYVLDLATGTTSAYLNVDNSISLFFGGSNTNSGDKMVAFTLSEGLPGDYNGDGFVDAADYTVWRNNLGGDASALAAGSRDPSNMGPIDNDDYLFWKNNYGTGGPGSGGLAGNPAVPEPGSLALLLVGLAGCAVRRRKK
jgi:hypothetical protein